MPAIMAMYLLHNGRDNRATIFARARFELRVDDDDVLVTVSRPSLVLSLSPAP